MVLRVLWIFSSKFRSAASISQLIYLIRATVIGTNYIVPGGYFVQKHMRGIAVELQEFLLGRTRAGASRHGIGGIAERRIPHPLEDID